MPMLRYWFSKVRNRLLHAWGGFSREISTPALAMEGEVLRRFHADEVGQAYGVGRKAKARLIDGIMATQHIPAATKWIYHVVLAHEILCIPPSVAGDVIECGCYKGASTSSLSLVCKLVGRRLVVCDSFQGLPDEAEPTLHVYPHLGVYGRYQKGMYAGGLEEVKANIARFGSLEACRFVPGFFADSLPSLTGPLVFAFADVDLPGSLRDCIQYIWPLLTDGAAFYTDDSCDMEVVRIWFDDDWWRSKVGQRSPGYVGSGCGLALGPTGSSLGYARKVLDPRKTYSTVPWLHTVGSAERTSGSKGPEL